MPPLTEVAERSAPRATWSCIDERHRSPVALARAESSHLCQGSGRAASLAPRSWHEPPASTSTKPTPLPGMLDEPTALFLTRLPSIKVAALSRRQLPLHGLKKGTPLL
jgi:hypothetical protein